MRLAIVGSRTFTDYEIVKKFAYVYMTAAWGPDVTIVSGGADGVDASAKRFAEEHDYQYAEYPADWNTYGKAAGPIRNKQIIENCDIVLAFWDGESKGTANTLELAKVASKPTFIVYI